MSGTSDSVIVVGAASKGIIQRDHQHNAVVYKTYYAPNPFDNMSEEEIEKYKADVENRGRGGESAGQYPNRHLFLSFFSFSVDGRACTTSTSSSVHFHKHRELVPFGEAQTFVVLVAHWSFDGDT